MYQIRTKFGAGALAPATLLGKKTPDRRSFGADTGEAAPAQAPPDRRGRGGQGSDGGGSEPRQGTLL